MYLGFYEKFKLNKIASMQSGRCVFLAKLTFYITKKN